MDQSPAVIRKQPILTNFKRPRENASDNQEPSSILTTLTREQQNTAIHGWRELHKYSFRDVDKLQSINTDKKRRIISKVMYIELGDYDPSNEYVANYSDSKTIRLQKINGKTNRRWGTIHTNI